MGKRIVVKIGSNVLTRADGLLDVTRLSSLVDQLAELRNAGFELVVVSSGAVAAGRGELRRLEGLGRLDPVSSRQLFSAVGQAKLINRYYDLFREHGMNCGQVLATKENFDRRGHYLNQKNCMETMLAHGVIPIVNENDTVSVTELMFTDNDELSGLIAAMMDAERLIILSNIDGMYTGDPADPASRLIGRIALDDDPTGFVAAGKSSHGRGGMASKCRIREDSAIAVIWALGMAIGILFVFLTPGYVPELNAFLFGNVLTISTADLWTFAIFTVALLLFMTLFYSRIVACAFDRDFARVMGLPVRFITYSMTAFVAVAIVLTIKLVGVMLLMSMFVLPQLVAEMFTHRFSSMMGLSVIISLVCSLGGLIISAAIDVPASALIVMIMVVAYVVARGIASATRAS